MKTWEVLVSIAAGLIAFITLIEKFGKAGKKLKKLDDYLDQLEKLPKQLEQLVALPEQLSKLSAEFAVSNKMNATTGQALLAIIRNDLYASFKEHRSIGAWTDDEFRVQSALHEIYHQLGGNGEESVWWDKKKTWEIVSQEEYDKRYIESLEGC